MSNALSGCLASLHFLAFALRHAFWNVKETQPKKIKNKKHKYGFGFSMERIIEDNMDDICFALLPCAYICVQWCVLCIIPSSVVCCLDYSKDSALVTA